ncbi:hypothetical protein BUALT_Bualt09G0069500 [Buddleja alternifolia]|uniref:F-box protein At3g26010-like beta-propeller domain-containing protein n=1 Tax=Buddleja alternifolia TaxID=168488 RepID=A0AAV6WZX8_9LAMI|nr:hypothetical protein BUALT_Bualt09G0069500 [Buddleja alternifolia]
MESRHPLVLGFFLLPGPNSSRPTSFISVSSEGTDLQEGRWGNLDETLSFLDHQTVIVAGSSKGFLLCVANREDNMTYIICNPVTRVFCILPKPHKPYRHVAIAFICKGDHISLDGWKNHYEIVRAGVPNPNGLFTTFEIETFSSTSGEWTESTLNSASPISLVTANRPAFVMGDVIYWHTTYSTLVAYDRTRDSVEVIEFPVNDLLQRLVCWSNRLSVSEGKIHYCMHNGLNIKVWMLADIQRREWILKHKVSFGKMFQKNPRVVCSPVVISVQCLHPQNSKLLLLLLHQVPYWYNLKNKKLSIICNSMGSRCLPYEWPSDLFA